MIMKQNVHIFVLHLSISYMISYIQYNPSIILKQSMQDQMSQQLQQLLEDFNKIDKKKQGNIKIHEALKLLKQKSSINVFSQDLFERVIFATEQMVTFDQFLALLHEAELDAGIHDNSINYKMVQFLKLLDQYRKKCEEASMYIEAQKAHQKSIQIRDKQMRRQKQKLMMQQKSKVLSVNFLQQNKLLQFNQAWNEYMEKYEDAALGSLEKLKVKHLRELEIEEERIRNYYEHYVKPSKKVIDLKIKQKLLVKQKQYMEAQKLKRTIEKIEAKEKQVKNAQISERIKKRKEILQKHQQASLMAHLKRIQKDRNDQVKKRELDSEKMFIKLKNIQNDIVQKQSIEIKETLQNLRQTMCLTSSQLFGSRPRRIQSSDKVLVSIDKQKLHPIDLPDPKRKSMFKVRVNSFHSTKIDASMYNP